MASKQRARAPKKERAPNPLVDLGMFDIPDLDTLGDVEDSDEDDGDLESELEAILSGKATGRKAAQPKKKVAAPLDIEKLAADCLKDVSEASDDDDLEDPDLLNELQGLACDEPKEIKLEESKQKKITPTREESNLPEVATSQNLPKEASGILSLLQERLSLYNQAVAAAKASADNSRVRRYTRGIKTLETQIKSAKAGKEVNADDIPPIPPVPKGANVPKERERAPLPPPPVPPHAVAPSKESPKVPSTHISPRNEEAAEPQWLTLLQTRKQKYKVAAVQAKRAGDKTTALEYMKTIKTIDALIEKNQLVDMSMIPPSPPQSPALQRKAPTPDSSKKEQGEMQASSSVEAAALSAASGPEDPTLFAAPPPPKTILEALQQRLEKFAATQSAAEAEGNVSKSRRLQRIVKSYDKAIKDYKAGKPVDFDELPTPPGFAPIPTEPAASKSVSPVPPRKSEGSKAPGESVVGPPKRQAPTVPPSKGVQPQKHKVQRTNTIGDRQLEFLLERQRLFREAALAAKKTGNIQQAKEYLRMSKGFDSMIEATKCGLPIDTSSIPTPPQLAISDDFVIIDRFELNAEESEGDLFEILEKDLNKQIQMCKNNKEHFLQLGDVSSASKFEKLGLESQKDLSIIIHLKKAGQLPPKFHYETRMFSIVQCNPDLADDQLELTVERGINLPGKPDDLDSYVKIEFPIPTDAPQKAKTNVVRDTNNPIFQEEFKFTINRKSRAQLRHFKRQALKLEVYSKGGFLRSDALLGTVSIKLVDLESVCFIHDTFDLMESNRKATGGKLECKVRIRQPLLVKQVEQVKEKWLVIGS